MRDLISKIQEADHDGKKRWLIFFCSVTMVFIIGLWIMYMKVYIFHNAQINPEEDLEIGFWPVFKNSITFVGGSSTEKGKAFISEMVKDFPLIKKEKTIEINGN